MQAAIPGVIFHPSCLLNSRNQPLYRRFPRKRRQLMKPRQILPQQRRHRKSHKHPPLRHTKKMLSPTEEAAGEAVLTEAVVIGSITGMGNTLRTARLIRRRATPNLIPKLYPKKMQRQRRRARTNPNLNLSQSHLSSLSRRTGCLRKVSRGTSIWLP